jgi:arylsulfatase A-like enzyme
MDVFDDDFGAVPGVQALTITKAWNQVAIKEHALRERTADRALDHALPWLEAHRDQQFFAFIHFYDVHGPYDAPGNASLGPPPTDGAVLQLPPYWPAEHRRITSVDYLERAYDEEVKLVDDAVGRIVAALGPTMERTIFVITADHGESFTEHDYLFDHGDDLYDPSLRVPLIVRYPPAVKAGGRVDCQVGGVDVTVTVLDLLGIEDGQKRDGTSRKGVLAGEPCFEERPVVSSTTAGRFVETPPVAHSFRLPHNKVIVADDKPVEMYDLATDPGELRNLAPSPAAEEEEKAFRTLLSTGGQQQAIAMSPEDCRKLAALGYVDGADCPQ